MRTGTTGTTGTLPRKNDAAAFTGNILRSEALQRILAFAALVLLIIFFSVSSPNFLRPQNIEGILLSTAVNGILAVGVTFVIITGGIDLSVGTVMTLAAVITAKLVTEAGAPLPLGILGGILTGALAGFINGLVIAAMRVPPFVATLGMLYVAKGLSLILSNLAPVYFDRESGFTNLATGVIVQIPDVIEIPNAVLIMFGAAIIGSFILLRTLLGRYTFALGSNEEAARISGVNTGRWKMAVYTLAGIFSGLAGVIIAARLNSAQPSLGQGYELDAIAAVVIGGTSLSGGEGSILGTVIGAFVISVLTNGLRILSVPQEWQMVVTGAIIIVAVFLDMARRRRYA
jgi:ribose transport system permease protein